MISVLTCTHIGQYEQEMFSRSPDHLMVESVDSHGVYNVGDVYYYSGHEGTHSAEVMGIYVHPESDCAWLVVRHPSGQMFEIEIEYDDGIPF